jgi:ankyrin repeat protein
MPEAATSGQLIIMKALLEASAAINSFLGRSQTPLGEAAGWGYIEATRFLLEVGADAKITDEYGDKPLHRAVRCFGWNVVALLLERGADVNAPGQRNETALVIVAKGGHSDKTATAIVQLLLDNGADHTTKDGDFGRTPLEWSILQGHEAMVEILLKHDSPDLTRRNLMFY